MSILTPWLVQKFYETDGVTPANGHKIFTYEANSSTKKYTQITQGGSLNTNPIITNSDGTVDGLWLLSGAYKIVQAPANDTDPPTSAIKTWDYVNNQGAEGSLGIVDTIAELKDLLEGEYTMVNVFGGTSVSDRTSLAYRWDATSVLVDDGLNIIEPTDSDGVGRWIRLRDTANSIADLKTFMGVEGLVVDVSGYYTAGDGKAIEKYWYDSTLVFATEPDNGGTIIQPLGVPAQGGWRAIISPSAYLTPYNFGAKGDGTTNDTTAFTNLFATTNNIALGVGRFVVNSTLAFTNETGFGDYYGVNVRGLGQNQTYIYAKNITGPLFQHPNTTVTLTPDRYYFSDFTVTGSNSPMGGILGPGLEANCSTTLTGFIGGANSGSMTLGFIAERVRVAGIATTNAKAWDLSQMFEVTLRNCHTQSIYNGFAYYGNTAGQTSTNIQISDCYVTIVKQGYEFINILSITFSNQNIFESCNVVGASFWSNITHYDTYLENIGDIDSPLGLSYKALDPLYGSGTPSLYYANGVSGARAYVNTAFYDVGGCLTFVSGEFTQIGKNLAGFFQGVGLNNGSSNGGKVTFINPRTSIRDRVVFYEQERNGYVFEVQDRHDRTATGNYCLIKTMLEARKLTKGTVFIRDLASAITERFDVNNGQFTFGLNPNTSYTTFPSVRTDELLPYKTGDRVLLNSGVNVGEGSVYQVYGERSYPTITSIVSAGGTTIPIADVALIDVGMKCIIKLTGSGSYTASAQTNSGELVINVASTTGILAGDTVVLNLTPTSGSPYNYTGKVGRVDSGTQFTLMYGIPDKIVIGGSITLTAGSHYTEITSINVGADTFEIADAIPTNRSVAVGASIDFWKWEKSGYGSTVGDSIKFTTSPKFTGGLNMLTGDLALSLENGDAGDLSVPAMKVKANRYVEFLDEDGSTTNASFIIQNSSDYLAFGHAGQSKIRLEPEGLAIGNGVYADTPNIISGSGDPATQGAQTFTASSSGGLLLTYVTNLPNYHRVRLTTTTTLPTGLSTGTDFWVVKVSETTCRLATSYANARAGTVVAYTDAGTGTHTINKAHKKGTLYIRIDGSSTSTRMYLNTDGAVTWTNLVTGA